MKADEWIRFGDDIPKLGKIIEVLADNGEIKRNIRSKVCFNGSGIDFEIEDAHLKSFNFNIHRLSGWRYQSEKRPDFSKLRRGDLVILELENDFDSKVGYVSDIKNDGLRTTRYRAMAGSAEIENAFFEIKKITRINIEEQMLEEI